MADTVASEQNPFEAWSKLIETTMKGNLAMPTTVEHVQEGENDPGSRSLTSSGRPIRTANWSLLIPPR